MKQELVRILGLACLYALAAPVFFVRWAIAYIFADDRPTPLDAGVMSCPWCEEPIPLARMNTCPACGFTSPSSLVAPCRNCDEGPFEFTACPSCGGSVKVL